MITGENWDGIMQDCMNNSSCMEVLQVTDTAPCLVGGKPWTNYSCVAIPYTALKTPCLVNPVMAHKESDGSEVCGVASCDHTHAYSAHVGCSRGSLVITLILQFNRTG